MEEVTCENTTMCRLPNDEAWSDSSGSADNDFCRMGEAATAEDPILVFSTPPPLGNYRHLFSVSY